MQLENISETTTGIVTNALIYTLVRIATQQPEEDELVEKSKKVFTIVDSINRNLISI